MMGNSGYEVCHRIKRQMALKNFLLHDILYGFMQVGMTASSCYITSGICMCRWRSRDIAVTVSDVCMYNYVTCLCYIMYCVARNMHSLAKGQL